MSLVKPFVREDHFNMVQMHAPDSETLFDFIPRERLPKEFGKCNYIHRNNNIIM